MNYQLEIKNIAKHYKDFIAVDDVNLQIKRGEIVSLLGASGCGKTTTLRMIAGLTEPTRGTIFIEGKDMTGVPPYKRDISMVFQNYALFPHMTVYENIVYGLRMRKVKDKKILDKRAHEMMDIVQLYGVENRLPRELSGGQQQRVSLARAMIVKPKVMLFDEPLSNLDAKLREQTRVEIRNLLKSMNVTAVYVTHDQEEALTISDKIAVMNKGKIEQFTDPETLYAKPASKFIANFVGHANCFTGIAERVDKERLVLRMASGKKLYAAAPGEAIKAGSEATIIIRPENTRISDKPEADVNTFMGKVESRIYMGSTTRYIVNVGEDSTVNVDVMVDRSADYPENTIVYIMFNEKHMVLVKG